MKNDGYNLCFLPVPVFFGKKGYASFFTVKKSIRVKTAKKTGIGKEKEMWVFMMENW